MNNWIGSVGRSRQPGLVLPVALLLLVVLTITAVASMRGTAMQERMAVGQIQMHSSFLDSEQLVWDAAACIRSHYIDGDDNFITPLPDPEDDVIADCGAAVLADGAVITWDDSVTPWRYSVIAARGFADTGAVSPVVLEVFTPGSLGGVSDPPPPFPNIAPYACFGPNCALSRAQSAASPTADGLNRLSPEIGERCRIQGQHRPTEDPEGGEVPGVIIPDGELIGNWDRRGAAEGDPPYIDQRDDWENHPLYDPDIREKIDEQFAYFLDGFEAKEEDGRPSGPLQDGDDSVWVAGPGQTITISGGESTVFGTVILDGGTLEMIGNQCFVGTILFRNGGTVIAASGTPAVVGSAIGYSPDDDDATVINPSLNGNPSFYYSERGMQIARDVAGRELGPGYIFEIARWRAPLDLSAFDLQ